ncbi:PREDICTED: solute carrier family 2, facilitated glucose transporter member 3-like [Acropora digitifera]|uniref:solute carrier family 2, facilitated glucose transporter member 3-like n=1 Tax=Acropora digitifera TaxID=70779 RepID=UPI00077AED02|nr:PREDICTED: solute carrier family 2, facilitated glucose transporter member 3-like [Acropora digitifera]
MDEEGVPVRKTEPLSSSEKDELIPRNRKAVSKSGWTSWLVYTAAVVVLGSSFQFGYGTSVMNAPEENIKKHFRKHGSFSDIMWSSAVAIFAIGGMFGVTVGQVTANSLGSKRALFLNNIPAIIGSVMMFSSYYAEGPALLIIGRFVFGFNNGVNTAVAPVYLSEIAPIRLRGALGVLNQFGIVLGLLSGYILGLKQLLGTDQGWPYLLGFGSFIALFQILTLPFCPRSPRYLLLKLDNEPKTVEALIKLRGTSDVREDIEEMRIEQEQHLREEKINVLTLLQMSELRAPLFISLVLQVAQQFSGINAVFYYSTSIFRSAGVQEDRVASCFIGIVSVVMTGITVSTLLLIY